MSDRESELLTRWHAEQSDYLRWGKFVVDHIHTLIRGKVEPRMASHFVRVPANPRLKDDESLIQKAFYRGKNYEAPYDDIEDKVGVRFVVLLEADVRLLGQAIEAETDAWTAKKARDHEEEIANNPYEFNYQSLHFIVRSGSSPSCVESSIPEDLPCEIQVRTLLQHAYSEVTHDTLYKPSIQATPNMKRAAAKSMALLEATGDYFDRLDTLIKDQVRPLRKLAETLTQEYAKLVEGVEPSAGSPLDDLVLDRYGHEVDMLALQEWLRARAFIGTRISEHVEIRASFRVPSILLVYYSAAIAPSGTVSSCPIPDTDLEIVYSDLGLSLEG